MQERQIEDYQLNVKQNTAPWVTEYAVLEICILLGCYAAYGGNSLPIFRDSLKMVPICCPETSVRAHISYTSRSKPRLSRVVPVCLSIYLSDDGLLKGETCRRNLSD